MPEAKGTMKSRVQESRQAREEMKKRFGFVPMSIVRIGRGALSHSMYTYQRENPSRIGNAAVRMKGKGLIAA